MKKLISECLHKDLNQKCGIYKLTCNDHSYIGSSINIYYRLKRHISDLLKNKHANKYMQNAFNKYGKNSFMFEVIEECSRDMLIKTESYYIESMSPDLNFIQNPVAMIHSNKTLLRISATLKEAYASKRIKNPISKTVHQYNINGFYLKSYESCAEAEKQLNLPKGKVSRVASRKGFSCGHYRWSYELKDELRESRIKRDKTKKVYVYDENNNLVQEWQRVANVASNLCISQSAMSIRIKKGNYYDGLRYSFNPGPG
jgi:group I intron endonuclease